MPFVNIRFVMDVIAQDPEGIKASVFRAVTAAIFDTANIPKENVWVVFEEVLDTNWFSGGARAKELLAQT